MNATPSSEQMFNMALSRVLGDDTTVLAADGTAGSTTALYRMDLSAGDVLVGGDYLKQAALTDTVLIGAGAWGKSFKLDGTAAAVLTADGKTYWYVLVAIPGNLTPALYAVFGAEANDTAEVQPTAEQVANALTAALGSTYKQEFGIILNRVKVQRAGGAITVTATDPAVSAPLRAERLAGTLSL